MSNDDFFFDEEDEKPAARREKPADESSAPKAGPASEGPAKEAAASGFFGRSLNAGIAVLLVVIALLIGLLLGVLIGQSRANGALLSGPDSVGTGAASAPPLSKEQLASGKLPNGHPALSATASAGATGN